MGAKKILDLRQEIDNNLSAYKLAEAKKSLLSVAVESVPTEFRHDFARLARRAGLVKKSIKFLHQNVHDMRQPSTQDQLEYASCIRKAGLVNQSLLILQRLPESADKLMYEAFCFVHRWEYGEARDRFIRLLENYDLDDKMRTVAKVNLLSCNIDLRRSDDALQLIEELTLRMRAANQHLNLNLLELKGQFCYAKKDFAGAAQVLNEARRLADQEQGTTSLFIQKWFILSQCHLGKLSRGSEDLVEFRKQARLLGHWESLRDFDWQVALAFGDTALANRVYFGTPHEKFKERILQSELGASIGGRYLLADPRSGDETVPRPPAVDSFQISRTEIPFGKAVHRLLLLLCSDFYQPWSIYRIHDNLQSDEFFDPNSSAKKVYQLIARLSDVLSDDELGLEFRSSKHGYRLRPSGETRFVVHDRMTFRSPDEFYLHCLARIFGEKTFSAQEVGRFFPMENHQIYRLLTQLAENSLIDLQSKGKNKTYKVAASPRR